MKSSINNHHHNSYLLAAYKLHGMVFVSLIIVFLIAACSPTQTTIPMVTSEAETATAEPTPVPSPTPMPKTLTICTAQEPASLYPLDGQTNVSRQTINLALFGKAYSLGPDPALLNVDPGNPEIFRIFENAKWSDGSPISSADFLLAWQTAKQMEDPFRDRLFSATDSFSAVDEKTIEWKLKEGQSATSLLDKLPMPLPSTQLQGINAEDFAASPIFADKALSWGPYILAEWKKGSLMQVLPNPNYKSPDQSQTNLELLTIRFVPELSQALDLLQSGECQALDASYDYSVLETADWVPITAAARVSLDWAVNADQSIELVFGIQSAANTTADPQAEAPRNNFFEDLRTRQAIAELLTQAHLNEKFYTPRLPETLKIAPAGIPGSANADKLLTEAGWQMPEGQSDGLRVAKGVAGVTDGTLFSVTLLSSNSPADQELSALIASALRPAGIEVKTQSMAPEALYAPGPEGLLFGRRFELAVISWQMPAIEHCSLYTSAAVPGPENKWIGTNLTGLASAEFDEACRANLQSPSPVSDNVTGTRCEGLCKAAMETRFSVKLIDRFGLNIVRNELQSDPQQTFAELIRTGIH